MGAVTAHTVLEHPVRTLEALAFFSSWEERVYHSSLRRSCQFAREAHASHPSPFWSARAAIDMPSHGVTDERALLREPDVLGAFERIKSIEPVCFERVPGVPVGRVPFIRGDEIVVEEGVTIQGVAAPVRFLAGVDLVALRDLACAAGQLPTLLDAYQRRHGEVPLPGVLAGLSLLVARGILALR
jgi:hypothetical protein